MLRQTGQDILGDRLADRTLGQHLLLLLLQPVAERVQRKRTVNTIFQPVVR